MKVEFFDRKKFAAVIVAQESRKLLLSRRACANVEPLHIFHEFGDFADLLAFDFAAKLSKYPIVIF